MHVPRAHVFRIVSNKIETIRALREVTTKRTNSCTHCFSYTRQWVDIFERVTAKVKLTRNCGNRRLWSLFGWPLFACWLFCSWWLGVGVSLLLFITAGFIVAYKSVDVVRNFFKDPNKTNSNQNWTRMTLWRCEKIGTQTKKTNPIVDHHGCRLVSRFFAHKMALCRRRSRINTQFQKSFSFFSFFTCTYVNIYTHTRSEWVRERKEFSTQSFIFGISFFPLENVWLGFVFVSFLSLFCFIFYVDLVCLT